MFGCVDGLLWLFFFKQKTAYEMRISDWSSDVCSSDLVRHARCTSRREDLVAGRDQQDTRTVPYFHLRVVGGSRHDEPCRRQPRSGSKKLVARGKIGAGLPDVRLAERRSVQHHEFAAVPAMFDHHTASTEEHTSE